MAKIGLKQLLERFNEIKVGLESLKGKHDLKTYLEIAKFSKDINDPLVFEFDSTSYIHLELARDLEKHKEMSLIGITKYIDNIFDRIEERVFEGRRYDRLERGFNLLVEHAVPKSYHGQADEYSYNLENLLHTAAEMNNAYGAVA